MTTNLVPHEAISFLYTADNEKERKAVCKSDEKVNKNNPSDAEVYENLSELIRLLS